MTTQTGDVFQIEIRTRNLRRTRSFYGALFDWKIYGSEPGYSLVDSGLMPVISLFETTEPWFPLGASTMVLADDCQKEADRAAELGGRITVRKWDVPNSGAFTSTLDPWGNELLFWQPFTESRPVPQGTKRNPFVLIEIAVPDMVAGLAYYSKLLGWPFSGVVFSDDYVFNEGCGLKRGVGLVRTGSSPRAAASTSYVAVPDLAAAEANVLALGGKVVVPATDLPGEGRFFVFEDLEGCRIGALQQS